MNMLALSWRGMGWSISEGYRPQDGIGKFLGITKFSLGVFAAVLLAWPQSPAWSSIIGPDDTRPVASLPPGDKMRSAARPIGKLSIATDDGRSNVCTAALISSTQLITASFCVERAVAAVLTLGYLVLDERGKSYPVRLPALKVDPKLNYAVLEVEGEPDKEFGTANLLVRIPIEGEKAYVVHHGSGGPQLVAGNCSIISAEDKPTAPDYEAATVAHDCDTTGGSSGAFLFSDADNAVLGIHVLGFGASRTDVNHAIPMYGIALADPTVRSIAAIRPPTIDFRSRNKDLSGIGVDIERLYLTLHNSLRLPIRRRSVENFKTIEAVFRQMELFFGSPFPVALDSMGCDLNPNVCSRERIDASAEERATPTRHVSGFRPSPGRWKSSPSMELWLPDIQFQKSRDWVSYKMTRGTSLAKIVVEELGGCETFNDECRQIIAAVNRRNADKLFQPEFAGPLVLPVASIAAKDIDISSLRETPSSSTEKVTVESIEGNAPTVLLQSKSSKEKSRESFNQSNAKPTDDSFRVIRLPSSALSKVQSPLKGDLDTVLRSLGSTATGNIRFKAFTSEPGNPLCKGTEDVRCELKKDDYAIYRDRLLNGLDFPYKDAYPPAMPARTSHVGVIDTQLDLDHCAFLHLKNDNRLVQIGESGKRAGYPASSDPCEWMLPRAQIDIGTSHGTHVAGIIAGRYKDLMWGLNPYATLLVGQVPLAGTTDAQEVKASDLNDLLKSMLARPPGLDVVNLSFSYPRQSITISNGKEKNQPFDLVLQTIRKLGQDTLFVVAAGNDNEQFSAICDSRPSCFDLPNVISVGALDGSVADAPMLAVSEPIGSNYGRRVHVAAPGRDIFSSISGHYFGVMTGTSQAAPQVAALASLVKYFSKHLTPGEVKERLITCAKSIPPATSTTRDEEVETSVIFGGRVDATCTLQKLGWLETKNGILKVASLRDNPKFVYTRGSRETDVSFEASEIRGIRANNNDNTFTIYHRRSGEDASAALSRTAGVEPRISGVPEQKLNLTVVLPNGAQQNNSYLLSDIIRFVPPQRKP